MRKALALAIAWLTLLSVAGFAAEPVSLREQVTAKQKTLSEFVKNNQDTGEDWKGVQGIVSPLLAKAETALQSGQDLYALQLVYTSQSVLNGFLYLSKIDPVSQKDASFLEAEWKRVGMELAPALSGKEAPTFEGVPSIVRAFGQVAWKSVPVYYESSIEYGRNTVADAGLYYLGESTGQLASSRYLAGLRQPAPKAPAFPGLARGMDNQEAELLARYKPPASIDSHPIFIRASAMLKEARELEANGMHEGALYMYLMSCLRLYRVAPGEPMTVAEATAKAKDLQQKLSDKSVDQSIALMFLQMAVVEAGDTSAPLGGQIARGVFEVAMPAYFAALDPANKQQQHAKPEVTVTPVRWPYT